MLLKVGTAMMLGALVLALVVAAVVALSGPDKGDTASTTVPVEPLSSEATAQEKREFDPGQKLELNDEPTNDEETTAPQKPSEPKPQTLPVAPADWPEPSGQE